MSFSLSEKFDVGYVIGGDCMSWGGFTKTMFATNRQWFKEPEAWHEAVVNGARVKLPVAPNVS